MTAPVPSSVADAHRRVADEFTVTAAAVPRAAWGDPAPPEGWAARDVVGHLVEWFPGFLVSSTGIELPPGPSVDEDPAGAWRVQRDAVQELLDDPTVAGVEYDFPHMGTMTLGDVVERIYVGDVFLHRWDLGVATGQEVVLDEATCEAMLSGMVPMEGALRSSGHYGPRFDVPDDAPVQDRLLAFIGRDPAWRPDQAQVESSQSDPVSPDREGGRAVG